MRNKIIVEVKEPGTMVIIALTTNAKSALNKIYKTAINTFNFET